MEKTYVVAWRSRSSASFGQSKKLYKREEAERLAEELNQTHPNFIHEALNLPPAAPAGPAEIIPAVVACIGSLVFRGSTVADDFPSPQLVFA